MVKRIAMDIAEGAEPEEGRGLESAAVGGGRRTRGVVSGVVHDGGSTELWDSERKGSSECMSQKKSAESILRCYTPLGPR